MKFTISIIAISLLAASIFGFAGISHVNMNCDPGSPTSTCPPSQIGMALHHLSIYSSYTQAVIPPETGAITAAILFLSVVFILFGRYVMPEPVLQVSRSRLRENRRSSFNQHRITHWLSLFENSPSAYPQR